MYLHYLQQGLHFIVCLAQCPGLWEMREMGMWAIRDYGLWIMPIRPAHSINHGIGHWHYTQDELE